MPRGTRGDRLVPSPVIMFSSERSGSTLLRVVLDSHSQIVAPHELHLRHLKVSVSKTAAKALDALGFHEDELANVLWDRMLHLQAVEAGKPIVVDKTPHNLREWRRISGWWPEARFLFLYRHPQRILESMAKARPDIPLDRHVEKVLATMARLREATRSLNGLEVRYERLTHEPEAVTREICDYLGVAWEPGMIDYGEKEHGAFTRDLGDWSRKIKGGTIVAERPAPSWD